MAIEALCPTCGAVFNLKDEYEGKKVRCKKCEQIFTVGGEKLAPGDDDDDRGVKAKARSRDDDDDRGVKTKADSVSTRKKARDDDDDDDRPSRKGRAAAKRGRDDDDDDDDKPRKRKRTYHGDDDDDDDDDRPRKRAPKRSSGGGSGKVIAIVGAVVGVVILVCAGAGYGIYKLAEGVDEAADQQQQDFQNAMNGGGNPFAGFPGMERQPKDMGEALTFLRGNDPNARRGAGNWLANQPLDAGKQKEVATALEVLVKDTDDNNCAAGAKAMSVWGTADNGPALATALRSRPDGGIPGEAQKQLMAALGHVKFGADEIVRFLNNFFVGGDAERALAEYGPTAEKSVLKAYFHPDGGARGKARGLCVRYETKPLAILDQAVTDLGSIDRGRSNAALEWLSRIDSQAALDATRADPARRRSVALALNKAIDDPQANGDQVLDAVKRWGTADNVAALVRKLERDPWGKDKIANALIAIGPACEAQVKLLLSNSNGEVVKQAKRILQSVGGAGSLFEAALLDLKSNEGQRIKEAAQTLQKTQVNQQQRPQIVSALLDTMDNTGPGHTDGECALDVAKAFVVWGTKDDASALADKLRTTNKFFTRQSRPLLLEWMGKQKAEKAIPFLASCLADRDDIQHASKALQAMGPDLGAAIERAVGNVPPGNDKNLLLEEIKILGAVGTKDSLNALDATLKLYARKDANVVAQCQAAINAIKLRGK